MSAIPSWLWPVAAAYLIPLGLWLLIRGRPFGRKQRFRRCAKCGYNLSGLDTFTCPECGRVAKDERELRRKPARWSWRTAGLLMFLIGVACLQAPRYTQHGWPGVLPDWLLARWAPVDGPAPPPQFAPTPFIQRSISFVPGPPTPPTPTTWDEHLHAEILRRFNDDILSDSAKITYLRRAYDLNPEACAKAFRYPAEWPSDRGFSPTIRVPNPHNSEINVFCHTELVRKPDRQTFVKYEFTTESSGATPFTNSLAAPLTVYTYEQPIDLSRPSATFMRPRTSPQFDADIAAAVNPRLHIEPHAVHLFVDRRHRTPAWEKVPCFLAYDATLTLNGRVIGSCYSGSFRETLELPALYGVPIDWREGGQAALRADPTAVTVTLTGLPHHSVPEFVNRSWMFPAEAWSGTVTVKPTVEYAK